MPEETKQPEKIHQRFLDWCGRKLEKLLNPPPNIVVLRLSGILVESSRYNPGHISIKSLAENIEKAFKTPNLKAVALAINSPGGSPVQAALVAKRIRDMSKKKEIPVFAFVEDVAASGGYWLACAADEIYANESSIVGSIGVISAGFGFQDAIAKLGVERRVHTSGDKKSILDPFKPEKDEDVKILTDLQKELHNNFIGYVRERRAAKLNDKDANLFSGEFWTGKKGKELGLVDEIGDMYEVMKEKFGDEVEFKYIHKPRGWLEKRMGILERSGTDNLAEQFLEVAENKALWQRFGL